MVTNSNSLSKFNEATDRYSLWQRAISDLGNIYRASGGDLRNRLEACLTNIHTLEISCLSCSTSINLNWSLEALLFYHAPPSAVFSPLGHAAGVGQWSFSSYLRGKKSAVNCAESSCSGWATNRSRQRGGIGDLLSSPGITCKRYTDWSHNKLTKPNTPPQIYGRTHTYTLSPKPLWGQEGAARKGPLLLLGLFSFGELRYCARVSRDDSSGQMNEMNWPPTLSVGRNKAAMYALKIRWSSCLYFRIHIRFHVSS